MVNLAVFDANGVATSRTSVPLIQDGEEPPLGFYCEWPDYSKAMSAPVTPASKAAPAAKPVPAAAKVAPAAKETSSNPFISGQRDNPSTRAAVAPAAKEEVAEKTVTGTSKLHKTGIDSQY
jgi:hypothetical protein